MWLQSDNTVKELRNTFGSRMMSSLCQAQLFSSCSVNHLLVGHTHEDIDAWFSVVATALSQQALQTPQDVIRAIDSKLRPMVEGRHQEFVCEFIDTVTWLVTF